MNPGSLIFPQSEGHILNHSLISYVAVRGDSQYARGFGILQDALTCLPHFAFPAALWGNPNKSVAFLLIHVAQRNEATNQSS